LQLKRKKLYNLSNSFILLSKFDKGKRLTIFETILPLLNLLQIMAGKMPQGIDHYKRGKQYRGKRSGGGWKTSCL
jgi:hypothetical protein